MTTFYALPSLTSFNQTAGWSLSSGGAPAGAAPGQISDDVVFDINSGPARSIVGGDCRSITTVGANAMTFTQLNVLNTANLTGTARVDALYPSVNPLTVIAPGVSIGRMSVGGSYASYVLGSDIVLTEDLVIGGDLQPCFTTNGYSVTARNIAISGTGSSSWGISQVTITGHSSGSALSIIGSHAFSGFSATWRFTDKTATRKTFNHGGRNFGTIWNDTCYAPSPGHASLGGLSITGTTLCTTFRAEPGTTTVFQATADLFSASNYLVDGAGVPTRICSSSGGVRATLVKVGGGVVGFNYCTIKDIGGGLTNGATWRALNSVDGGNNLNWTFVPNNSRLLMFF